MYEETIKSGAQSTMEKRRAPVMPAIPAAKATSFLLLHLLYFSGPALGSPLARLGFSGLSIYSREAQTHSQTAPQLFTNFRKPVKDDELVTGTDVLVSWATGGSFGGTVVLELGEASEDAPLRSFVHTECTSLHPQMKIWRHEKLTSACVPTDDIPFLSGNYTMLLPETLQPGSYAFRIAQSTTPTTYVDSPVFTVIHAAPPAATTTSSAENLDAPTDDLPPLSRRPSGLSEGQKIGVGTGIALAVLLLLGGFLIWRQTKRQARRAMHKAGGNYAGSGVSGSSPGSVRVKGGLGGIIAWGNVSPRTVVASSPAMGPRNGGLEDEYKLPEGVMSIYDTSRIQQPIELPAEVCTRSSGLVCEPRANHDGDLDGRHRRMASTTSLSPSTATNEKTVPPPVPPKSGADAAQTQRAGKRNSAIGLRTEWRGSFRSDDGDSDDGFLGRRGSDSTTVEVSPVDPSGTDCFHGGGRTISTVSAVGHGIEKSFFDKRGDNKGRQDSALAENRPP